jgi:hypothetical protein
MVFAAAVDRLKLNAGVVVDVATLVVNKGLRLPAEKLVTVPPLLVAVNVPAENVNPDPMVTFENPPDPLP